MSPPTLPQVPCFTAHCFSALPPSFPPSFLPSLSWPAPGRAALAFLSRTASEAPGGPGVEKETLGSV